MNVKNYGNRGMPSVNYARQNIAARYENHAMMRRNESLFSCCHHGGGMPIGGFGTPGLFGGGFGFPMMGGFPSFGGFNFFGFGGGHGNTNVTINTGPSNSMAAGYVVGTTANLGIRFAPQIGNFFKNLFGKA